MKRTFLIVLLFVCVHPIFAQNETLKKEILGSEDSQSIIISKGRTLLLEKFLAGDMAKVAELENYLSTQLSDKDYLALYPVEKWLVKYWTRDYNNLLPDVKQFDSFRLVLRGKILPQYDNLLKKLEDKTYEHKQEIIESINQSALSAQDKDFLVMNLLTCLFSDATLDITQNSLNQLADDFIQRYPGNEYIDYTRKYIRFKYEPSKWGFGFEFFSGYGIFTGSLKNYYTNNIPFGVAFDVAYKDFTLYLRDYIGFNKTKVNFTGSSEMWSKDSKVRVFVPEATLGYNIHNSKRLKVTPFAGISSMDIGPTEYDVKEKPRLADYELTFTTTYTLGCNFDIKLGKPKASIVSTGAEQSYTFLRVRYTYQIPQFSKSYYGFDGNMHTITVGIGAFGRRIKRVN